MQVAFAGHLSLSHLESGIKQAFITYVLITEYQNTGVPHLIKPHSAETLKMLSEKLDFGKANNIFNVMSCHLKNTT